MPKKNEVKRLPVFQEASLNNSHHTWVPIKALTGQKEFERIIVGFVHKDHLRVLRHLLIQRKNAPSLSAQLGASEQRAWQTVPGINARLKRWWHRQPDQPKYYLLSRLVGFKAYYQLWEVREKLPNERIAVG